MKSKLTLRLEEKLIEKSKKLSEEKKEELTHTVKKLKGLLKNKNVKEEDYKKHLQDKY